MYVKVFVKLYHALVGKMLIRVSLYWPSFLSKNFRRVEVLSMKTVASIIFICSVFTIYVYTPEDTHGDGFLLTLCSLSPHIYGLTQMR